FCSLLGLYLDPVAGEHLGPSYIIPRSLFVSQTSYFFIIGMLPVSVKKLPFSTGSPLTRQGHP
ncbi:hypothetical protein M3194_17450, partial [Paenibacillus glycanilyticus]|uniref:hypothetical protein n=1 Tax=Paenibacillus glycanilyticus TaxID=126569 RepID=UPI00203D2C9C